MLADTVLQPLDWFIVLSRYKHQKTLSQLDNVCNLVMKLGGDGISSHVTIHSTNTERLLCVVEYCVDAGHTRQKTDTTQIMEPFEVKGLGLKLSTKFKIVTSATKAKYPV